MKASTGLVLTLVVCALLGIGALGYNRSNNAPINIETGGKDIQNVPENVQNENGAPNDQHTITASAETGGSISPSGSMIVPCGATQAFVATASDGYRVVDVLVDGKSVGAVFDRYHDNSSSYTFSEVAADHVISASFAINDKP